MKLFHISIAIFLGLTLSCQQENFYKQDHFFVKNKGASMPVFIQGDLEAQTFILFLHGGPGGNASQATFLPVFQELSESFALAYWDQRGSGLSQGNPDQETFTVAQFVEDLDMVIDAIKQRFDSPDIYLFGHSWGGALGAAYLSTANLQDKISGFINMDSGHNLVKGLPLSVKWVQNYAENQLDNDINRDYWAEVRDWCAAEPDMTIPDNYFQFVSYLRDTDAYRMDNQVVEKANVNAGVVTNSFMSLAVFFNGAYLRSNFNILELNLSEQMRKIKTPTLILWGRHDGVNTIEMGYDAFESIGGEGFMEKELVILENSAHEGYVEERDKFLSEVRRFVGQ